MERTVFNYAKLRGKIKEVFNTEDAFANRMGVSRASISLKLNSKNYFSQSDIIKIADILGIEQDQFGVYFFTPRVQKCEQNEEE